MRRGDWIRRTGKPADCGGSAVQMAWLRLLLLAGLLGLGPCRAIGTAEAASASQEAGSIADSELDAYQAAIERRMRDESTPLEERAEAVLEAARRLDEAARVQPSLEARARRWSMAVALLDRFSDENPAHPGFLAFELQAGSLRWAEGKSWARRFERDSTDETVRDRAIEALDDAIDRFRATWIRVRDRPDLREVLQATRLQYAQALTDRADLEEDEVQAGDFRQQALARLQGFLEDAGEQPPTEAVLLRIRLLIDLDRLSEAESAWSGIEGRVDLSKDPTLETRVDLLLALKRFHDAVELTADSELDRAERDLRALIVRSRQRLELFPGQERLEIEREIFERLKRLRDDEAPQLRPALLAVARAMTQPDSQDDPAAWALLADGYQLLGKTSRAVDLNRTAARLAEAADAARDAWLYRYKAAALLTRAGRLTEAVESLDALAKAARDPDTPAADELRTNASLLEALVRGRLAAASGSHPTLVQGYERSLRRHIEAFPTDPSAHEARWALGRLKLRTGDVDEAVALWQAIPLDQAHGMEARVEAARARKREAERRWAEGNRAAARSKIEDALELLETARGQTQDPEAIREIELAQAELELTPGVGFPARAITWLEHVVQTAIDPNRRARAERLRAVAVAIEGRPEEADEAIARVIADGEPADWVELARRLDQLVAAGLSDSKAARASAHVRRLAERALQDPGLADDSGIEAIARVLRIQGQFGSGDVRGARASARSWAEELDPETLPLDVLERLCDAYEQLGLYEPAVPAYRVLTKARTPGTLPWFEARYGLAVAYYRSGEADAARRLIDGTSALHPELGGGDLREKFFRLRRRLDTD